MKTFYQFIENNGKTIIAYHQTSLEAAQKIRRYGFNFKTSLHKIVWFTNDLTDLENGSSGRGAILKLEITIDKSAGWKEYDKFVLDQIERNFDSVILPEKDGTFTGFVFDPKRIKVLEILNAS